MDEREFEQAAINTEQINASGLERVRRLLAPESHPDFDGKHCIDCDSLLPKQRLQAGRIRCTDCQSLLEQLRRRRLA